MARSRICPRGTPFWRVSTARDTHSLQSAGAGPLGRGERVLLAPHWLHPLVLVLSEVVGLFWGDKRGHRVRPHIRI